jgi:O-succinylbenzoate synthase
VRVPALDDLLADVHVVALPMRIRFRGITTREMALLRGPAGWGEFGAFPEYADGEAAHWLANAIEAAWEGPPPPLRTHIPVNATVPAVTAARVPEILDRFPGVSTAKVKVAERGQTLADDLARVNAVRACVPHVRVDANGGWNIDAAETALRALTADGPLQYAEQPCATTAELAELRKRLHGTVLIAADESIRRAEDPLAAAFAGALDIAVVKVAPLGGMRRTLAVAEQLGKYPIVISSALDSATGMNAPLAAAAALPGLELACGLATGEFFTTDVAAPRVIVNGTLSAAPVIPDPARLAELAAAPDRRQWWLERLRRCYAVLTRTPPGALA